MKIYLAKTFEIVSWRKLIHMKFAKIVTTFFREKEIERFCRFITIYKLT